ncbi:MAG TPA: SpoIID/LytB domain-containing protein [Gemmatimonadaceae bacterium]|nr:SpoIID/LytB domain-containing protein [Gemmatimonadaceae bacterium]
MTASRTRYWIPLAAAFAAFACAPVMRVPAPEPEPTPAALGRDVRIGVVQSADSVLLGSPNQFEVGDMASGRLLATGSGGTVVVRLGGPAASSRYSVTQGTSVQHVAGPVVVISPSGIVTIGDRTYRGRGEARINSEGRLAGVNELPVERYLYGVVPRELGPVVFPEVEGQKAQAISARTYALSYIGRRAADGYDLRATVDDQVYGGYADEHPVSNAAVDATAGVVLTHGGRMVLARYSSTSGGHTADNEESFAEGPVPYLRGVPDVPHGPQPADFAATLEAFKSYADPWNLRLPPPPFDLNRPRYHRWTFEWTAAELSSVVSDFAGRPVGAVHALNAARRGPSGRIITLDILTDSGTVTVSRGAIRAALRYVNSAGARANLPSALFFVEPVGGDGGRPTGFRVYGGGFGHGTGMAQVGAVLMARNGMLHPEILRRYYQGAKLQKLY